MSGRWRDLLDDPVFLATAGATEIGNRVAEALLACIEEGGDLSVASRRALELKPAMATVHRAVAAAREPDARGALVEYLRRSCSAQSLLASHGAALVPREAQVLVHSRSGAVLAVLREAAAAGKRVRAYVTTGWPLAEGRQMAADLVQAGLEVTLIPDAAVAAAAVRAARAGPALALVGADAVLPGGDVINKVGTRALALAARDAGIPFYVAAESLKFWPGPNPEDGLFGEEGPAGELGPPAGALAWNPLFERVPAALVTAVITEDGPWTAGGGRSAPRAEPRVRPGAGRSG